jgi:hypothetical protein
MKAKTTKILGRPIDAFAKEEVVTGYLITVDGRIWTRLHTRGLGKTWKEHDWVARLGRETPLVALMAPGRKRPRELSVARLMLRAAFGQLPGFCANWAIRYLDGDKSNCALENLRFGPPLRKDSRPPRKDACPPILRIEDLPWRDLLHSPKPAYQGFSGDRIAANEQELRSRGFDYFDVPI